MLFEAKADSQMLVIGEDSGDMGVQGQVPPMTGQEAEGGPDGGDRIGTRKFSYCDIATGMGQSHQEVRTDHGSSGRTPHTFGDVQQVAHIVQRVGKTDGNAIQGRCCLRHGPILLLGWIDNGE